MMIPYIRTKPMVVTVLVAGTVSLLTWQLPYKLGLITAAVIGIFAGISTEKVILIKKYNMKRDYE